MLPQRAFNLQPGGGGGKKGPVSRPQPRRKAAGAEGTESGAGSSRHREGAATPEVKRRVTARLGAPLPALLSGRCRLLPAGKLSSTRTGGRGK